MNRRYAKITYRKYRSKWQLTTLIISICLFIVGFACVFLKLPILFLLLIFFGFYVFFMSWFGYLFQASVSYKDMTRFYGDPIKIQITFYKEFFRIKGDTNNFDFPYSQITDIIELEDISILIVSAKGIITLRVINQRFQSSRRKIPLAYCDATNFLVRTCKKKKLLSSFLITFPPRVELGTSP